MTQLSPWDHSLGVRFRLRPVPKSQIWRKQALFMGPPFATLWGGKISGRRIFRFGPYLRLLCGTGGFDPIIQVRACRGKACGAFSAGQHWNLEKASTFYGPFFGGLAPFLEDGFYASGHISDSSRKTKDSTQLSRCAQVLARRVRRFRPGSSQTWRKQALFVWCGRVFLAPRDHS